MTAISTEMDRALARVVATTGRWKRRGDRLAGVRQAAAGIDLAMRAVFHLWRNRRYLTFRKLVNMGLVNLQFTLKTERVIGRPYKMKIESTNICNTKCQLCPTGLGREGRAKGKMAVEKVEGLVDRFKKHLVALDLSMWGDPMIHPEIFRMIRYAHDRGIWTYISSNLHAYKLPERRKPGQRSQAELLVESGLDLMTCSLHGASQATYEMYQPGKKFDEAIRKIREIVQTRDRMGSSTPQVQLNFVVMKQNEHERAAFEKLAAELGCKAIFSMPSMNARFVEQDQPRHGDVVPLGLAEDLKAKRQAVTKALLSKWLPRDTSYRLSSYDQMLKGEYRSEKYNGKKEHFCDWLWRQAVVNWDGQVSTCCGSFDPDEDMGNVFDQDFGKIWNGRKYRMARRSFKKPLTEQEAKGNGCATCPGFMV